MHVLVIDDSDSMRNALQKILEKIGFTVSKAGDGQEALKVLTSLDRVDLIVVDWVMPVMDGLQFVRALRRNEIYSSVPVVMVSAQCDPEDVHLIFEAGVDEYIMKPVKVRILVEKIEGLGLGLRGSDSRESDLT